MKNTYLLQNAIIQNSNGFKHDVVATSIDITEIKRYKKEFIFDFVALKKKGLFVYKICKSNKGNILQGMVCFTPNMEILDCYNMELNNFNKRGSSLYNGVGKCMVALCCKISFDLGFEGFITFEAKSKLVPYYERLGAKRISYIRMAIDSKVAKKLVAIYFKKD
ncbi:MAG: hypothetical protein ACKVOM_09985 [Ferruginibacter sp.]